MSRQYQNAIHHNLWDLIKQKHNNFCDATFIIGSGDKQTSYKVVKALFCIQSVKLKDILTSSNDITISMKEISPETFQFLLASFHGFNATLTPTIAGNLDLRAYVRSRIRTSLRIGEVLYFAQLYEIPSLEKYCFEFIEDELIANKNAIGLLHVFNSLYSLDKKDVLQGIVEKSKDLTFAIVKCPRKGTLAKNNILLLIDLGIVGPVKQRCHV